MHSKVSIIIPTYNGEKYIRESIDSCLNQTYNDIEIIVVDDCSNDSTVEILKTYGNKIKLTINQANQGIVKNLNNMTLGLDSEYFIFLGHDDILPSNHIEVMLNEFDDDTVAVHCNSIVIDGEGKELGLAREDKEQVKKTDNIMFELSIDNFISSCGILHKTEIFKKLNGWDETYKHYGEWLYYIKELEYGKIKYTTNTKAFYRKHDTNITKSFKNKKVLKELSAYKNFCRDLAFSKTKHTLTESIKFTFYRKIQIKNWLIRLLK